ncbi:hypothetical protein Y032_0269g832 [Ancylostoma ceylanicum]|nr:hypothetical protein Y032_0269g832 [Ancylostoma ceylanicum]
MLAQEIQIAALKALEAFWIRAKNPEMNRKEKYLSITRELNPYLRHIFRCSDEGELTETLAVNKENNNPVYSSTPQTCTHKDIVPRFMESRKRMMNVRTELQLESAARS